jgi:hypothetical protein
MALRNKALVHLHWQFLSKNVYDSVQYLPANPLANWGVRTRIVMILIVLNNQGAMESRSNVYRLVPKLCLLSSQVACQCSELAPLMMSYLPGLLAP